MVFSKSLSKNIIAYEAAEKLEIVDFGIISRPLY